MAHAPTPQDIAGFQALHAAAHDGDLDRLDALLKSGATEWKGHLLDLR